jgi:PAS domain-containing protein
VARPAELEAIARADAGAPRTRDRSDRRLPTTMITHPGASYVRTRAVRRRVAAAIERDRGGRLALAVTDSVADGLYVVDGGESIIYLNRAGLRMLGYEAEELIGRDARTALRHGGPDGSPPAPRAHLGATPSNRTLPVHL